jgi:hypothetical protein
MLGMRRARMNYKPNRYCGRSRSNCDSQSIYAGPWYVQALSPFCMLLPCWSFSESEGLKRGVIGLQISVRSSFSRVATIFLRVVAQWPL